MNLASPCISVCRLNARGDLCVGCWRTLDEIRDWAQATEARKRDILRAVAERRDAAQGAGEGPESAQWRAEDE